MSQDDSTDLTPFVFSLRIVIFALILSVAIYAGIAVFLVNFAGNGPMAPMNDLMTWVALGFGAVMALLQAVVPGMILSAARQRIAALTEVAETNLLLNAYRSRAIVGAALCEGGAFMALTTYLLEGNFWLLQLTAALMLLTVMRFPSVNGVSVWLEQQHDLLQGIRVQ